MDVVCYAVRETLKPVVLLEQLPISEMETLLQGFLGIHSSCAGQLLLYWWLVGGFIVYQVLV